MPEPITGEWIVDVFSYHELDVEQREKTQRVIQAAKAFASVLWANAPDCADKTYAIRCLRQAVLFASSAIALNGRV